MRLESEVPPLPFTTPPALPGWLAALLPLRRGAYVLEHGLDATRRIHFVDEGEREAPAVVMLHGNPAWCLLWRKVVAALPRCRCIAPDLLGLGLSSVLPSIADHSIDRHADALVQLLDALALPRYVLVGQDWGGPMLTAIGVRRPERVAGIAVDGPIQVNCTGTDPAELSGSSVAAGAIYAWTGPLGFISNQQNITVAYPGDYTLVVTGPNGCTSSDVATVQANQDSDVPTAAAGGGTLTCSNTSVKLNGESSTPDVTFKWTGPGGFTSTLEDPVVSVPGLYVFTVSAPNGCFNEVTVNVLSDVKIPEYTLGVIPQLNCDNDCITLNVTTDPPGLFPDPYSVCEPGAYNVTITNPLNGCANAVQFTVTEAPPLSGNLSANLDCDLNGTLTAEVTGGTPPYHYLWSTGDTTATIQLPLTGPLAFTVTDAGGCKFETGPVIISVPATLVTTSILTNASTPDATDGGIDLSVSGGIPPYTYIWSTGATTQDLINIPAGDYYVTVTDANGCTRVALFTVDAVLQAGTPPIVQALTLTPNPTTGPARLTLQLERPAPVRVSVYDLTGRLVLENRAGTVSSLNWPLDLSSWPPGLYKVLVLAEDQTVVCKLAVGR